MKYYIYLKIKYIIKFLALNPDNTILYTPHYNLLGCYYRICRIPIYLYQIQFITISNIYATIEAFLPIKMAKIMMLYTSSCLFFKSMRHNIHFIQYLKMDLVISICY